MPPGGGTNLCGTAAVHSAVVVPQWAAGMVIAVPSASAPSGNSWFAPIATASVYPQPPVPQATALPAPCVPFPGTCLVPQVLQTQGPCTAPGELGTMTDQFSLDRPPVGSFPAKEQASPNLPPSRQNAKQDERSAKIFVHDSNGALRHVAQCSHGESGMVEVNVLKQAQSENAPIQQQQHQQRQQQQQQQQMMHQLKKWRQQQQSQNQSQHQPQRTHQQQVLCHRGKLASAKVAQEAGVQARGDSCVSSGESTSAESVPSTGRSSGEGCCSWDADTGSRSPADDAEPKDNANSHAGSRACSSRAEDENQADAELDEGTFRSVRLILPDMTTPCPAASSSSSSSAPPRRRPAHLRTKAAMRLEAKICLIAQGLPGSKVARDQCSDLGANQHADGASAVTSEDTDSVPVVEAELCQAAAQPISKIGKKAPGVDGRRHGRQRARNGVECSNGKGQSAFHAEAKATIAAHDDSIPTPCQQSTSRAFKHLRKALETARGQIAHCWTIQTTIAARMQQFKFQGRLAALTVSLCLVGTGILILILWATFRAEGRFVRLPAHASTKAWRFAEPYAKAGVAHRSVGALLRHLDVESARATAALRQATHTRQEKQMLADLLKGSASIMGAPASDKRHGKQGLADLLKLEKLMMRASTSGNRGLADYWQHLLEGLPGSQRQQLLRAMQHYTVAMRDAAFAREDMLLEDALLSELAISSHRPLGAKTRTSRSKFEL